MFLCVDENSVKQAPYAPSMFLCCYVLRKVLEMKPATNPKTNFTHLCLPHAKGFSSIAYRCFSCRFHRHTWQADHIERRRAGMVPLIVYRYNALAPVLLPAKNTADILEEYNATVPRWFCCRLALGNFLCQY